MRSFLRLLAMLDKLAQDLKVHSLFIRGIIGDTTVLIGNCGKSLSYLFDRKEFQSPANHPLDCWSREVIGALAKKYNADSIYPFDGPPYEAFPTWAIESRSVFESPLGILIDPIYGLWHGYRGALRFNTLFSEKGELRKNPCESCHEKPCLDACDAFTDQGFFIDTCKDQRDDCLYTGCLARVACPIGKEHKYGTKQMHFHMKALSLFS